jgi:protocatechuate 3,4-dioxygenase beta subunit
MLSAGLLAVVAEPVTADVSVELVASTVPGLLRPTESIARLAKAAGAGRTVARWAAVSLAASALVVAIVIGVSGSRESPLPKEPPTKEPPARQAERKEAPAEGKISFAGRVIDTDGKPVKGATVFLFGPDMAVRYPQPKPERGAVSDADGAFQFESDRSSFENVMSPNLVASADGYGVAIERVSNSGSKAVQLKLVKDAPLRGRLFDLEGKAVGGATVRVLAVRSPDGDDLTKGLAQLEKAGWMQWLGSELQHFIRELHTSRYPIPGVPETIRTDADGRFELKGIGVDRLATLQFAAPTIATTDVHVLHQPGVTLQVPLQPKKGQDFHRATIYRDGFDLAAAPPQIIEGTITDKESGKPLSGFTIGASAPGFQIVANKSWKMRTRATTDENGRYRLVGCPAGVQRVVVFPPADQPYFRYSVDAGRKDSVETVRLDFTLPKATFAKGRVTDTRTNQAVGGVRIHFAADVGNKQASDYFGSENRDLGFASTFAYTAADGTFRILAMSGRGWLLAANDKSQFVPASLREPRAEFEFNKTPAVGNDIAALGIEVDAMRPKEYAITVDSGPRISVKLIDANGKPVVGALRLDGRAGKWSEPLVSDGFEVALPHPNFPPTLTFVHPARGLGVAFTPNKNDNGPWKIVAVR